MFLIYMSSSDWLWLIGVTVLLVLFYYLYQYYLQLKRKWKHLDAEMEQNRQMRPVGWTGYLVLPKSPLKILAFYLWLGAAFIIIWKSFLAGLFWFICAGAMIWIIWVRPGLLKAKKEREKEKEEKTANPDRETLEGNADLNDSENIGPFYK